MIKLLLATRNAKKLVEMRRMLNTKVTEDFVVLGLSDVDEFAEAPETGETFEETALAKARDAAVASGLPAIADDSGLAIDALNGMPGVLSARWAGQHGDDQANLELVLAQMRDVPTGRRGAKFVCAMALVLPDGTEDVVSGHWPGHIATAPRGAGGFGYDPIFVPTGGDVTAAELPPAAKDAASHRGIALRAMIPRVLDLIG